MMKAVLIVLLIVSLASTDAAWGTILTVNSTIDAGDANPGDATCDDGDGNCTLRAAIMEANAMSGADTITLSTATYTLTIAPESGSEDASAARGDLDITEDLTITGPDQTSTVIDCARIDRAFDIHSGSTVTITGVTVRNGYTGTRDGGNIRNAGSLTIDDSTITLGESLNHAGGILSSGILEINGSTISSNKTGTGGSGGGIHNSASATITGSTITDNFCGTGGAGIYNGGTGSTMEISNSTISHNDTKESGIAGGISNRSTMTIRNCNIEGNTAALGGGISNSNSSTMNIFASTIRDNQASSDGGGIWDQYYVTLLVENTLVVGNTAGDEGGGIYASNSSPTIVNSTFSGNSAASRGGAIYSYNTYLSVTNTILWGNSVDQVSRYGRDPTFSNCDIEGSIDSGTGWDSTLGVDGGGNIDTNPLFVSAGDYHLSASSPCIDSGTSVGAPVTDIDGETRPQGTGYDIGADEVTGSGDPTPTPTVTGIDPATGINSGKTIDVTITGAGFRKSDGSAFSQVTAKIGTAVLADVTVSTPTSLTATYGIQSKTAGAYGVTVTTEYGTSAPLDGGFVVTNPSPTVTSISPTSADNSAAESVTIEGTGFLSPDTTPTGTADPTVGMQDPENTDRNFSLIDVSVVSTTTITGTVPEGRTAGIYDVVVTNSDGQSATGVDLFEVTATIQDTTNPSAPTGLTAEPGKEVWTNDNTIQVSWSPGTDEGGVAGYSYVWDTHALTDPDNAIETTGVSTTSGALVDSDSHYFHLRTVDNAGNTSSTVHFGPFYIDTVPPGTPSGAASSSHSVGVCSSDKTIDVSWNAPDGGPSGIAGFSVVWDSNSITLPGQDVVSSVETTTSPSLIDGAAHYVHIRAVDGAGNGGDEAAHLGPFCIGSLGDTLHVGNGGYQTIQSAIDAASNGDTIIVRDGTYTENVDVNKSLVIQSENGPGVTTVQAASPADHVFDVNASTVEITGLTVRGATEIKMAAIDLSSVSSCRISDNKVEGSYWGIRLYQSGDIRVENNTVSSNLGDGVSIASSNGNAVTGNTVTNCKNGIYLAFSDSNRVTGNTVVNNDEWGVYLAVADSNTIRDNEIGLNGKSGVLLHDKTNNNTISSNTISSNVFDGIVLKSASAHNVVVGNTVSGNQSDGIFLGWGPSNNRIIGNTVESSTYCGISLWSASDNTFYLNNLNTNSSGNVCSRDGAVNRWYSTSELYYDSGSTNRRRLGNYYNDNALTDTNGDGITDADYGLPGDEHLDEYPLAATSAGYSLHAWWLHNDSKMYRREMSNLPGDTAIDVGSTHVWLDSQEATSAIGFSGSFAWLGQIAFAASPASGDAFVVEIGTSADGLAFTPGGPEAVLLADGAQMVFSYETGAAAFSVPVGGYLALRLTNNGTSQYGIRTGGDWSYTSSVGGSGTAPTGTASLTVSLLGEGSGAVASSPVGIDTDIANLSETYDVGTAVVLTAAAHSDDTFAGWSGDCTGIEATCTLAMDADRTVSATFADTTAPTEPSDLQSSPPVSTPSNDNTVEVMWTAGTDAGSSVAGYSYVWDTSSATDADNSVDTDATSVVSPALPDGSNHWFHICTVDNAGNTSGTVHLGPFYVDTGFADTTPPSTPGNLRSAPVTAIWTTNNTVEATWTPGDDPDGSGVAGYNFEWNTNPDTILDSTVKTILTSITSPPLADGSDYWLHVCTVDNQGNASDTLHLGPFNIDTTSTVSYEFERMWPSLQQPWYFQNPVFVAVDASGYVYISDSLNNYVTKFTSDGRFVSRIGAPGFFGPGQFYTPFGIAVDDSGYIYVVDRNRSNSRIQKLTTDGEYVASWGSYGTGEGRFDAPCGVAVDNAGNVYVTDQFNHRIQKFTDKGEFILKWGSEGSDDGQFNNPYGIAVDGLGYVYVADQNNDRIQKFTPEGQFVLKWAYPFPSDGHMTSPFGIAVDGSGFVYVTDHASLIQKFTSDGQLVARWGFNNYGAAGDGFFSPKGIAVGNGGYAYVVDSRRIQKLDTADGQSVSRWESKGNSNGRFNVPTGIAMDDSGFVYVADYGNDRIQKFSAEGQFVTQWGTEGGGEGQFSYPQGVAVDSAGNVYVADWGNHRIQKFGANGDFLAQWGSQGTGEGQFNYPADVAVGDGDRIYVVDRNNHRIQEFTSDGQYVSMWGAQGGGDGQFNEPNKIAVDSNGSVYVGDEGNQRIQKFDGNGNFLTDWGDLLWRLGGISTDRQGYVYVADSNHYADDYRLLKFDSDGTLVAAWGSSGSTPGRFYRVAGLCVSPSGSVYVSESDNNRIQVFKPVTALSKAKAIVVAGGGSYAGNNLWTATQLSANFAYRALSYQGFSKASIHYLTSANIDLDDNGVLDDVSGDATNNNLEHAITAWALDAENLVVYLVDHGGKDTFRMSGTETLPSLDLASWLDQLQQSITGKVTVVYDACESGTFLPALVPPSGKERIVLTSTSPDESAIFVTQGSVSFSNYFWTHVFNGLNIKHAFALTKSAMEYSTDNQHPLLDDNGNGVGNDQDDGLLAAVTYIGNGTLIHGDAPTIGSISPDQTISDSSSALLYADGVTDDDGIGRVWAIIRPPDYRQGASANPVSELPFVDLKPVEGDRYEVTFDGFNKEGTYQLAIYAMDGIGNATIPVLTTVTVNNPLKRRAIIVAGGSQSDALWPAIEKNAGLAYEALRFQGYSDDDIHFMSPVTFSAGVDRLATVSELEYAISGWTGFDTQDLVVYMIGDGGQGTFNINSTEQLAVTDLDTWLDSLQAQVPGVVTVIYDARESGSFLGSLLPPSGKERIVLASTRMNQSAYFLWDGDVSFSRFLWGKIANGADIRSAFVHAKKAMSYLTDNQVPQIDGNGNGIPNEKVDGYLPRSYTLGVGIMLAGDDPLIGSVSPGQTLSGDTSATIWAEVTTTGAISRVWAVITPPNHQQTDRAVIDLPSIDLVYNNVSGRHEGTYESFGEYGSYHIVVYASDAEGNISLPLTTAVAQTVDMYEDDDTYEKANVILIWDPDYQRHNLHTEQDEDWVKFYAVEGETYRAEVSAAEANCDTTITIFSPDGQSIIEGEIDDGFPGEGEYAEFDCLQSGIYYVRIRYSPEGLSEYGEKTGYSLSLSQPYAPFGGYLTGYVTPAVSTILTATSPNAATSSALTLPNGGYLMAPEAGTYKLTAVAEGYDTYVKEGVEIGQLETTTVDINLTSAQAVVEPPGLDQVTSPTNVSPQTLSGTKGSNTSVWLNGTQIVSLDAQTTWTYQMVLAEGSNSIDLISKDSNGNESTATTGSILYDITAPTCTISYNPSTVTNQDVVATCTLSDGIITNEGGGTHTFAENGSFTFTFADSVANTGSEVATVDWIDKTAPVVDIGEDVVAGLAWSQTASAIDVHEMTYLWTQESGSGTVSFGAAGSVSTMISASADGTYVIRFTATDAAGNSSQDEMTLVWDTQAPIPELLNVPEGVVNNDTLEVTVSGTGVTHYKYRLDDESYSEVYEVGAKIIRNDLTEGIHSIYVISCDAAGNWQATDDAAIATWEVQLFQEGDINDDGMVELGDALLALQVLAEAQPAMAIHSGADVNDDGAIGLVEVIYILQKVAGLR